MRSVPKVDYLTLRHGFIMVISDLMSAFIPLYMLFWANSYRKFMINPDTFSASESSKVQFPEIYQKIFRRGFQSRCRNKVCAFDFPL